MYFWSNHDKNFPWVGGPSLLLDVFTLPDLPMPTLASKLQLHCEKNETSRAQYRWKRWTKWFQAVLDDSQMKKYERRMIELLAERRKELLKSESITNSDVPSSFPSCQEHTFWTFCFVRFFPGFAHCVNERPGGSRGNSPKHFRASQRFSGMNCLERTAWKEFRMPASVGTCFCHFTC